MTCCGDGRALHWQLLNRSNGWRAAAILTDIGHYDCLCSVGRQPLERRRKS
jgi:hypothetical protein